MKFFAALLVLLPVLAQATPLDFNNGVRTGQPQNKPAPPAKAPAAPKAPAPPAFPAKGGNGGQGGNAGNNKGGAASSAAAAPPAASSTAAAPPAAAPPAAGNNAGGNNAAAGGDPQTSLTLLDSVIAKGFANNGQDQPTAGQVASATSTNNFINFCATVPNLQITNGLQIKEGSCNPAPMGVIASTANMPSCKFTFPKNGQTIPANQDFTITMAIKNLNTGFFTNPNENYFAAPQTVDGSGNINGHSHVVVDKLSALDQTTPTDPTGFVFFKGLNDKAANGVLSATVPGGLPAGTYRLSSINSSANHQPALVAVAQHGALDDMVYFTVADNAQAAGGNNGAAASSAAAAAPTVGAIKGNNTGKQGAQGGFAPKGGKKNRATF